MHSKKISLDEFDKLFGLDYHGWEFLRKGDFIYYFDLRDTYGSEEKETYTLCEFIGIGKKDYVDYEIKFLAPYTGHIDARIFKEQQTHTVNVLERRNFYWLKETPFPSERIEAYINSRRRSNI